MSQEIKRGVGQGCVLSPEFFMLYIEIIVRDIKNLEGIKFGGGNINTALVEDWEEKLKCLVQALVQASEKRGL